MLLTITSTASPASDLGYLLHKHPARAQSVDLPVGTVHVFYPEAGEGRCTAALLLEVDPIGLVRGASGRGSGFALAQYVNDRPYAASSMLAVALGRVFRTAMTGRCDARPELAATALPLRLHLPALPCQGGAEVAARVFEPLGWEVVAREIPLDPEVPAWGPAPYLDVTLSGTLRLADALSHLYVLLPVLDGAKHYWVGPDEVDKLLRAGQGWLARHPEREFITRRYLARSGVLTRQALARLAEVDDTAPEELDGVPPSIQGQGPAVPAEAPAAASAAAAAEVPPQASVDGDRPVTLAEQRRGVVLAVLRGAGARRVADLGCGEGALLADLVADPSFTEIIGADVSVRALESAARRLHLHRLPEARRERVRLVQSSLVYRDERLAGWDAAVLSEVVEHVDPSRLAALERCVLGEAAPATVVVTTPNKEYNVHYPALLPGGVRHRDHRFEWTRAEFAAWAEAAGARFGYRVRLLGAGPDDAVTGPPTQVAVFTRGVPA